MQFCEAKIVFKQILKILENSRNSGFCLSKDIAIADPA
jgi:hypothetical protein